MELSEKTKLKPTGNDVEFNQKALFQDFTGDDFPNTRAILDYYKPLEEWLDQYIKDNNVHVGWPGDE